MPLTSTLLFTGQKLEPAIAPERTVYDNALLTSGSYQRGTLLGQVTATGRFAKYATGNSDGSQNVTLILAYDCLVDASGNVTLTAGQGAEWGVTYPTAPVYLAGFFRTEELVGLDSGAVSKLGRIIRGNTTSGLLAVY